MCGQLKMIMFTSFHLVAYDEAFKKYLSPIEIMINSFNVTRNRIS